MAASLPGLHPPKPIPHKERSSVVSVEKGQVNVRDGAFVVITEASVLAAGYVPKIGFLHTGKPQSFVYDIGYVFKFKSVVQAAFKVAARAAKRRPEPSLESAVRRECRDLFRRSKLLGPLIPRSRRSFELATCLVPTRRRTPIRWPSKTRSPLAMLVIVVEGAPRGPRRRLYRQLLKSGPGAELA